MASAMVNARLSLLRSGIQVNTCGRAVVTHPMSVVFSGFSCSLHHAKPPTLHEHACKFHELLTGTDVKHVIRPGIGNKGTHTHDRGTCMVTFEYT